VVKHPTPLQRVHGSSPWRCTLPGQMPWDKISGILRDPLIFFLPEWPSEGHEAGGSFAYRSSR